MQTRTAANDRLREMTVSTTSGTALAQLGPRRNRSLLPFGSAILLYVLVVGEKEAQHTVE